eukprot:TRINITY_DN50574_c0_g1_i2.p1 TRINITY_DN50574_c0_g1~~TRINITY_DN50574_c0_g1_i2.p1  ORF type:complete len:936 (-),score=112.09 TRINITY_DN50574_c0_g1_i2:210-3017(-)
MQTIMTIRGLTQSASALQSATMRRPQRTPLCLPPAGPVIHASRPLASSGQVLDLRSPPLTTLTASLRQQGRRCLQEMMQRLAAAGLRPSQSAMSELSQADFNGDSFSIGGFCSWLRCGRIRLWLFLDDPFLTFRASCVSCIMVSTICASMTTSLVSPKGAEIFKDDNRSVDFAFSVCFCVEVLVRIVVCPVPTRFLRNAKNVIDFASVLPFLLNEVIRLPERVPQVAILRWLSSFEAFLRLLKLSRYFWGWQLLFRAILDSATALVVPLFFLLTICVLGSCALFVFETIEDQRLDDGAVSIRSLSDAVHFSIVCVLSMSTGPFYSLEAASLLGQATVCALMAFGMVFMAMPIAIVGSCFSETWFNQDRIVLLDTVKSRLIDQGYTPQELRDVFDEVDEDGSGEIEFHEFKRMIRAFNLRSLNAAKCHRLFHYFDTDGDGAISFTDFATTLYPDLHLEGDEESSDDGGNDHPGGRDSDIEEPALKSIKHMTKSSSDPMKGSSVGAWFAGGTKTHTISPNVRDSVERNLEQAVCAALESQLQNTSTTSKPATGSGADVATSPGAGAITPIGSADGSGEPRPTVVAAFVDRSEKTAAISGDRTSNARSSSADAKKGSIYSLRSLTDGRFSLKSRNSSRSIRSRTSNKSAQSGRNALAAQHETGKTDSMVATILASPTQWGSQTTAAWKAAISRRPSAAPGNAETGALGAAGSRRVSGGGLFLSPSERQATKTRRISSTGSRRGSYIGDTQNLSVEDRLQSLENRLERKIDQLTECMMRQGQKSFSSASRQVAVRTLVTAPAVLDPRDSRPPSPSPGPSTSVPANATTTSSSSSSSAFPYTVTGGFGQSAASSSSAACISIHEPPGFSSAGASSSSAELPHSSPRPGSGVSLSSYIDAGPQVGRTASTGSTAMRSAVALAVQRAVNARKDGSAGGGSVP